MQVNNFYMDAIGGSKARVILREADNVPDELEDRKAEHYVIAKMRNMDTGDDNNLDDSMVL